MRGEHLITNIAYLAGASWLLWAWVQDTLARRAGANAQGLLPGSVPASPRALLVAVVGALVLLAGETGGEWALGLTQAQDKIAASFLLSMLGAAVVEEVIFRGYLVFESRGKTVLWVGVFACSLLFALMHPYLWDYQWPQDQGWRFWAGQWTWQMGLKGWFSTGFIFAHSLLFYAVRFMPLNPERSLLPCIVAHAVTNVGVFAVKAAQGFVVW